MNATTGHRNVELKARCSDPARVRRVLEAAGAEFRGVDRQRDVYFRVPAGRLKLRVGTLERALVHYRREDRPAARLSHVSLARLEEVPAAALAALEAALTQALGVRSVVEKTREIRFVDNVKFHLDEVPGLGWFVEIEAIDADGSRADAELARQCADWRERLGIAEGDLVGGSYGEMGLEDTAGRS